jgi:hypothetical protein
VVFFAIWVLTCNLYLGFRSDALGSGWQRSQVQTVRWRLFQTAGKIVRHGRQTFRKIGTDHVGHVRGDPRALRAHHAGRRCHSADVVILGRSRALGKRNHDPGGGAVPETFENTSTDGKNRLGAG